MKIDIITKRQMQIEIAKAVEKREFKTLRLINILSKRISKMEEEIKVRK